MREKLTTLSICPLPEGDNLQITRQHNRTKQQAKAWVDVKLGEMLQRFGDSVSDASHQWQGDTMEFEFRAAGLVNFSGTLAVTDSDFHLDLPFPFLAKSYEGRAEVEINRWLDDNLTDRSGKV